MKLYLSCRRNHTYMLTQFEPVRAQLEGFAYEDYYVRPGDPVGYTNMCALITPLLARSPKVLKMRPLDPPILVQVEINPA